MRKIRKVGPALGTLVALVLTALPAAAQQYPPPQPKETVVPKGEVAFTGADLTFLIAAVAVLLVVGVSALILARRRAASAA
jgi:hypothetical protein